MSKTKVAQRIDLDHLDLALVASHTKGIRISRGHVRWRGSRGTVE